MSASLPQSADGSSGRPRCFISNPEEGGLPSLGCYSCRNAKRLAKGVMSGYEVRATLGVLDFRERLMFRLAVFSGMRPGEIFSVRIGKVPGTSILVDERTYQNKFDRPKGRKGKSTTRRVGVSLETAKDIDLWRSFPTGSERNRVSLPFRSCDHAAPAQ